MTILLSRQSPVTTAQTMSAEVEGWPSMDIKCSSDEKDPSNDPNNGIKY